MFAICTHQSYKDRCTPMGVSSLSAARHAFQSVWAAQSSAPDKGVAAKGAT